MYSFGQRAQGKRYRTHPQKTLLHENKVSSALDRCVTVGHVDVGSVSSLKSPRCDLAWEVEEMRFSIKSTCGVRPSRRNSAGLTWCQPSDRRVEMWSELRWKSISLSAQTEKSTLLMAVINSPKVARRVSSMHHDSPELESAQSDRFSPTSDFQSLLVA